LLLFLLLATSAILEEDAAVQRTILGANAPLARLALGAALAFQWNKFLLKATKIIIN
jgi:hypothetical protein